MQHDFQYVPKTEYAPEKEKLRKLLHLVQKGLTKTHFTFQYNFIGSSSGKRNMITRDLNSNTGYDFDINIYPNISLQDYTAKELRLAVKHALDKYAHRFGYDNAENGTRVLTIKYKDTANSQILHSCDIAIIIQTDQGEMLAYCQKENGREYYTFEKQPDPKELNSKIDWLKTHNLWQDVRDKYLYLKNTNTDKDRKSRSMYAEAINNVYNRSPHPVSGFYNLVHDLKKK